MSRSASQPSMIRKSPIPKGQINKPDNEGNARLHLAVLDGNSMRAKELLTEEAEEANPNVEQSLSKRTPLHLAANHKTKPKKSLNIAKLLLFHGATVDPVDSKKRTPLHYACRRGRREMVFLLLSAGAKTDVIDIVGKTPRDLDESQLIRAYEESLTKQEK